MEAAADNVPDPVELALGLGQERLRELFRQLEPAVWVLRIKGNGKRSKKTGMLPKMTEILTGFCISDKGYIVTCVRPWIAWSNVVIEARKLNEDNFKYMATVIHPEKEWDMVLLSIENLESEVEFVELTDSSDLGEGDILLHISHPLEFVGSCLAGRAVYGCPDDVLIPTGTTSCENYACDAVTKTPPYRVMGHVWNARLLVDRNANYPQFEMDLDADLPIIQCSGLTCGPGGSSGGPIYNIHGKLIGLVIMQRGEYQIGVPVPIIRELVKRARDRMEMERVAEENMKVVEARRVLTTFRA